MATDALAAAPEPRIDGLFLARTLGRMLVYAALLFWAFVCLFPIYWTVTTTSFKSAVNVTQGHRALARLRPGLARLARSGFRRTRSGRCRRHARSL